MNIQDWLRKAVVSLSESESPRRDAEILLEFVIGKERVFFYLAGETLLTTEQEERLSVLLARRKAGEPIAYLTGECGFWSLLLNVSSDTLIPRPDTECLVEQALMRLSSKPSRILDLGTGSGAIALALASERPDCSVTAIDLSSSAIELVYRNIERLSIHNVHVLKSYWFDKLFDKKFEMIVSNPPYLDAKDPHLLKGDLRFEPLVALVSPNNGMADLNYIIRHAHNYLTSDGWLLVEHGWMHGSMVQTCFIQAGYQHIETYRDYGGNERLTLGKIT